MNYYEYEEEEEEEDNNAITVIALVCRASPS
jgi:hypothetical protein